MLLNHKKINEEHNLEDIEKGVNPSNFITSKRIDLVPKILYLQNLDIPFFEKLYIDSIKSLNGLKEDDWSEKSWAGDFLYSFNETHKSIKSDWFSSAKSIIPISWEDNILLDWAHRVASAFVSNKEIGTVKINQKSTVYNYNFFASKGLDISSLDLCLQEYIKISENHVFSWILWGRSKWKVREVKDLIWKYHGTYITTKEIVLSEKGKKNIIVNCYGWEKWLWNINNNFVWAQKKVDMCFWKNDNKVRVLFFEFIDKISPEKLIELKSEIRDIFWIWKNSIHITDNKKETLEISNIFLNENSIHFLNNMEFKKYNKFINMLEKYKNKISDDRDTYCITWSWVLSLYWIREWNDLDYITIDKNNNWENHNSYINKYLWKEIGEIIHNPKNYFLLTNWLKVLSIDNIKKFKNNRDEWKDRMDIKLIENTLKWNLNILWKLKTSYLKIKRIVIYWTLNACVNLGVKLIPKKYIPFFKKIYYKIIS